MNPTNDLDPRPFMAQACDCGRSDETLDIGSEHELPRADFVQREGNLFGGPLRGIIGGGRVIFAGVRSIPAEVWKRGEGVDFTKFGVVDAVVANRTREIIDAKKYGEGV